MYKSMSLNTAREDVINLMKEAENEARKQRNTCNLIREV